MLPGKRSEGSYTMQHVVMSVAESGPAYEAGLRQGDLITHINGESIQGGMGGVCLSMPLYAGVGHLTVFRI